MYYGMQTNGSVWDKPVPQHWTMHYYQDQAARPEHEYDSQPSAQPVQTMGLGLLGDFMQSPIKAAMKTLRPPITFHRRIDGVGAEEEVQELPALGTGSALIIFTGIIVIGGILSYQAGKAMAPTTAKEKTWGWIGVPVGLFTGTLGLGIMGIVSNRSK